MKDVIRKLIYAVGIKDNNSSTLKLTTVSELSPIEVNCPVHVHMLWIGDALSELELASIRSFLKNGFIVNFWIYNAVKNVPDGVVLRDANEIIDGVKIRRCKKGSYAAFSDFFRYKVIQKESGLWADVDVICLVDSKTFSSKITQPMFVTERIDCVGNLQVNNNLFYLPSGFCSPLLQMAGLFCSEVDIYVASWGAGGPRLLTGLYSIFRQHQNFLLMSPDFANPIPSYRCPADLLREDLVLKPQTWFLHCFNETWRRSETSKDLKSHSGSFLHRLVYGE